MSSRKRKILAVYTIFDTSDELTVGQILDKLQNEYGITADRKSIYDDIAVLTEFLPIVKVKKNRTTYYKADFTLWR